MWHEEAICDAIASKTVLSLVYHDELRELEPHILGYSTTGVVILNGWQISRDAGWRNFHLSEIMKLDLTDKHFWRARPDYRRDDATFAEVICQI
jgi:predicted DNA-binding transcriptional regulator YafY